MAEARTRRTRLRRLEDQVLRETGNRFARRLLLSADGTLLWRKDGSSEGVKLTDAEMAYWRGGVDLAARNHPLGLSSTGDDVLTAIMLEVRGLNAFSSTVRFRFVRKPGGTWPPVDVARDAVLAIDLAVRSVLAPAVEAGTLAPAVEAGTLAPAVEAGTLAPAVEAGTLAPGLAVAVHRHRRWVLFAQRFAAGVDHVVEQRSGQALRSRSRGGQSGFSPRRSRPGDDVTHLGTMSFAVCEDGGTDAAA